MRPAALSAFVTPGELSGMRPDTALARAGLPPASPPAFAISGSSTLVCGPIRFIMALFD
jgi:hypothetical protein